MPRTAQSLPVTGFVGRHGSTTQLVLHERLTGRDTFLTGILEVAQHRLQVRIVTLDDVTVLRPVDAGEITFAGATWTGVLHLPHGARPPQLPADLMHEAAVSNRALDALDDAELRYALTFLEEATTADIRQARVSAIVAALPPAEMSSAGADHGQPREMQV